MTSYGAQQTFDPRALGLEGTSLLLFMGSVEKEMRRHLEEAGVTDVVIRWETGLDGSITVLGGGTVEDEES